MIEVKLKMKQEKQRVLLASVPAQRIICKINVILLLLLSFFNIINVIMIIAKHGGTALALILDV